MPIFCFSQNSEYQDEREMILDAIRDGDKEAWQIFQASKLLMLHPMTYSGLSLLEKLLECAAKFHFDGDWDNATMAKIEFYTAFYQSIGLSQEQAKEKAEKLVDGSGDGNSLGGLL